MTDRQLKAFINTLVRNFKAPQQYSTAFGRKLGCTVEEFNERIKVLLKDDMSIDNCGEVWTIGHKLSGKLNLGWSGDCYHHFTNFHPVKIGSGAVNYISFNEYTKMYNKPTGTIDSPIEIADDVSDHEVTLATVANKYPQYNNIPLRMIPFKKRIQIMLLNDINKKAKIH